jgi:glycopeptide antibiotics resistance protein
MKHVKKILIPVFYTANLILVMFYLYPGSIFGCFLYNDCYKQPQITRDFIISSNHLYAFIILSALGIIAYQDTRKIKIVTIYLFLLSIILELAHIVIPSREFEWTDLFGNIAGVVFVIIIYKIKNKYV